MLRQGIVGILSTLLIVNWAVLMSIYTFEIQYSCEPLVGASTCVSCAEADTPQHFWQRINLFVREESLPPCPDEHKATKPDSSPDTSSFTRNASDTSGKNSPEDDNGRNRKVEPKPPIIEPETLIKGSVAGAVVAVGAVIIGAPAIIVIGVGVAVWLTASALLSSSP